ncbi:hypothetical protein H7198_06040 [Fructobacillus sp. CRL 2054]|uniref:hypothetical protein n=1 Tax=Fructobacillus sp. CRL 2054 TaxID=2763007 RepID=UPI002378CCF2|nr:hypothetical protein [Fructobacillus sp. CRL 2054]MDD9139161.1 hypothetical protein [Fructobacillus sp. CRL 2054]
MSDNKLFLSATFVDGKVKNISNVKNFEIENGLLIFEHNVEYADDEIILIREYFNLNELKNFHFSRTQKKG